MLNRVIIMGRLTADPELRTTTSGISVASFSVAIDRYSKQGADRQTDFIPVVAWRERAEFVSKYFRKGSMIAVEGSLQSRKYEDKTGAKRTAYEVVADNISFCGSKAESGASGGGDSYGAPPAERSSYSNAAADDFSTVLDDDLPF